MEIDHKGTKNSVYDICYIVTITNMRIVQNFEIAPSKFKVMRMRRAARGNYAYKQFTKFCNY